MILQQQSWKRIVSEHLLKNASHAGEKWAKSDLQSVSSARTVKKSVKSSVGDCRWAWARLSIVAGCLLLGWTVPCESLSVGYGVMVGCSGSWDIRALVCLDCKIVIASSEEREAAEKVERMATIVCSSFEGRRSNERSDSEDLAWRSEVVAGV